MRKFISITSIIFSALVSCSQADATDSKGQENIGFTIHQNIKTMDIHGMGIGFCLKYETKNTNDSELELIKIRIDSTVRKIATLYSFELFISFEKRDSVDRSTINEILQTINQNSTKIDNLIVKNIGIPKNVKNAYIERENFEKDELKYYQNLLTLNSITGGYFSKRIDEERETYSSLLNVKTKYNSNIDIDLFICKRKLNINSDLKNSISQPVKDLIKDSLAQFSMYEMWTLNKRYDIEKIVENIITSYDPETRWVEFWPLLAEEVEKKWTKLENEISLSLDKTILLNKKIKSNQNLSEAEIIEINNEILELEEKIKLTKQSLSNEKKL